MEWQTRSRSQHLFANACKPLMPQVLPALVAATHCRMNGDRNDIGFLGAASLFSPIVRAAGPGAMVIG
jgi:hypothetical protein